MATRNPAISTRITRKQFGAAGLGEAIEPGHVICSDKVRARNFHKWCRQQLVAYGQPIPAHGGNMFEQMVDNVIRAVDRQQIPAGQYQAILIDEGHDFAPEWLKLV